MKKQPLDYFRNDPWAIRLLVLVIVYLPRLAFAVEAARILLTRAHWPVG